MVVYGITFLGFTINLLCNRKRILVYQLTAAFIHLVSFVFIREFGAELIIYLLFSTIPAIRRLRYLPIVSFVTVIYIMIELFVGVQRNFYATSASFFVMYYAVIITSIINYHGYTRITAKDLLNCVRFITIAEIFITLLLFYNKSSYSTSSLFVVNHQPVGVNLSVIGSFFVSLIMTDETNQRDKMRCFPHLLLYVVLALLMHIRGYILIIFPMGIIAIYSWFRNKFGKARTLILTFFIAAFLLMVLYFMYIYGLETIRIDTEIGYRSAENEYTIKAMSSSNPFRMLFGYGIFSQGKTIGNTLLISSVAENRGYIFNHLESDGRYLNFWLDVLKDTGMIGLILILKLYFSAYNKETNFTNRQGITSILFYLLYAVMMLFRNSCTCAMLELFVFHLVRQNYIPGEENEYSNQ